jgi:hypothetical protein
MGEMVLYAYGMCGVRRTALTQQHFEDARMAMNLLMASWSAKGVNLWAVDRQKVTLVQGQSTYPVPPNTIVMLDAYFSFGQEPNETDRIMMPISRSEYATYPNKKQQGAPTVFWFDRLLSPTVTLWPVPNGQQSFFKYYRLRQAQDSVLANGTGIEVPIYLLEPLAFGLAARLALIWAADKAVALDAVANRSYNENIVQNIETANTYIAPAVNLYYR